MMIQDSRVRFNILLGAFEYASVYKTLSGPCLVEPTPQLLSIQESLQG